MRGAGAWRALAWPALATAFGVAILIGLGAWQVERLAWKERLIAAVAERVGAPPAALPAEAEWAGLDPAGYEYRHVRLVGRFLHQDEAHLFTNLSEPKGPIGGIGAFVLTPLVLDDGSVVIVDRGFVPASRLDPATRPDGQVPGRVEVTGLMRSPEPRNWFTPADRPDETLFYARDAQAIARARGLERVAPFTVSADRSAPGGLPQGGETRLAFPNRHLEYALTWFGLAAALVGVFAAFAWRRLRPAGGS